MTPPRSPRALIAATRPFAKDQPRRSWWFILSTLSVLAAFLTGAVLIPWIPLRLLCSVGAALTAVRFFSLYHDYMHGGVLQKSMVAKLMFHAFGLFILAPPSIWRFSHNIHHASTGCAGGRYNGSFEVLTTDMWRALSPRQQLRHRLARHPVTIALGYFSVFMFGMCLFPFFAHPRKNIDSAVGLLLHLSVGALTLYLGGLATFIFAFFLPMLFSSAVGAYLFYAQHNFEACVIEVGEDWSYVGAALHSSSFIDLGPLMRWFTGNIGYHHVHHLNARIPCYRLPEAMAAIPELQTPGRTSFGLRDVVLSFRQKLWDPGARRWVAYSEA
ncbi:MAG: fatty acid desaturase [Alphaproteobacteria bacterium]|nr:fatty acid desaturase [Alphaproteobacteria bacterium]MCB9797663.1 fatty acid desaturase [Alphaproteobacteria bacterium]